MKLFSLLPKRLIHLTCNSPGIFIRAIRHSNVHPMGGEGVSMADPFVQCTSHWADHATRPCKNFLQNTHR